MKFTKDPQERLDYWVDWGNLLNPHSDSIASSSWVVEEGLMQDSPDTSLVSAVIWLSGGTLHERYEVTNHMVSAQGRIGERSFTIEIKNK